MSTIARSIRCNFAVVAFATVLIAGCSATSSDLLITETISTSTSASASVEPQTGVVGTPVPVTWGGSFDGIGTITINSLTWESNPARVPSNGARLVADVTAVVESGTGEVDPYYWLAFGPGDEVGNAAGVDTSLQEGGMVALPIKAGTSSNGLITWDIAMTGPIRITVTSNLAAPVTWNLEVIAPPITSDVQITTTETPPDTSIELPSSSAAPDPFAPNGLPAVADTLAPIADQIGCSNFVPEAPVGTMLESATCQLSGGTTTLHLFADQSTAEPYLNRATEAGINPSWISWVEDRIMIVPETEADSVAIRQALGTF